MFGDVKQHSFGLLAGYKLSIVFHSISQENEMRMKSRYIFFLSNTNRPPAKVRNSYQSALAKPAEG